MRYLKNKSFQKKLKENDLDDEDVKNVLNDIFKGRAAPLGSKLYKIRGAKDGRGKSGGFRSLFFWKKDERIIFCWLFAKNEQDNLSPDEDKALKILCKEYDGLTGDEIRQSIERNNLMEIQYDKQSS